MVAKKSGGMHKGKRVGGGERVSGEASAGACTREFATADSASGLAHLPDRSPLFG